MANMAQEKEIYKKKAMLLSYDEIVSKKTGEAMVKASFFVDGAVYLAWLFGNERSDFLANPKVQANKIAYEILTIIYSQNYIQTNG